jgi:hypothetical protein
MTTFLCAVLRICRPFGKEFKRMYDLHVLNSNTLIVECAVEEFYTQRVILHGQ